MKAADVMTPLILLLIQKCLKNGDFNDEYKMLTALIKLLQPISQV